MDKARRHRSNTPSSRVSARVLPSQHAIDQFVEIGIVRKDDVSALIPDKP